MARDFVVQIMRGLLAEQICVRDLSTILEAMLELRATIDVDMGKYIVFPPLTNGVMRGWGRQPLSQLMPADYVEFIRARLRRYISRKYTRGANTLVVYLMDPRSEQAIRQLELNATAGAAIRAAVREKIGRCRRPRRLRSSSRPWKSGKNCADWCQRSFRNWRWFPTRSSRRT